MESRRKDFKAVIHIVENTPPNSYIPLFDVWYNGEKMIECFSWGELKTVMLGELIRWYEGEEE